MKIPTEVWVLFSFIMLVVCIRDLCIIGWYPADPRWFIGALSLAIITVCCALYVWDYFYRLGLRSRRRSRRQYKLGLWRHS